MAIKSMIRLNQLVTQQGDYDITAENSAKSALAARSDADEALKNIVESLVQRHGIGSASGGFLADNAQGVLAHFTSGVTNPLVIKHEGTDAAADIEIDSVRAISADALISSNFTVTGSGQGLTLEAAGGGAQKLLGQSAGTGVDAVHLNASAGGVQIDAAASFSVDGADDSNVTVTGAAKDLTLSVAGGGAQKLLAQSAGTGADAIHLNASAGGFDVDSVKSSSMNVVAAGDASGAAVLTIGASHSGTDGGDSASIDMDAKTQIDIASAGSGANAIYLNASAGGLDFDAAASIAMDAAVNIALASTEDTTITASDKMVIDGQVDDTAISGDYSDPSAAVPGLKLKSSDGGVFLESSLDMLMLAGLAGVVNGDVMNTAAALPDDAFTYTNNIATDMGTNNGNGLNHLILSDAFCTGEYDSGNGGTAVWEGMGIPLSMASAEWYDFSQAFGEISLLRAVTQAMVGASDSFYAEVEVTTAVASGNLFAILGSLTIKDETGATLNAAPAIEGTTSLAELQERIEVYVNGQRMALNGDCTPTIASSALSLAFDFALEVGDMIIIKA